MGFGRDVLAAFAGHGDRVAMVSGRDQITYAQALIQIDHLAANFSALGIRPGDRVGLAMIGNIDVVLSTLACWKLGATVSIVADQASVAEFEAFLRANISPDRRPREIRLVGSLPYNDNGKLLRRRLVETLSPAAAKP